MHLIAVLVLAIASPAMARDESVPLYSPEEALQLAAKPAAYMVDDTTCERVEGQKGLNGGVAGAGATAALFRLDKPNKPFMRMRTRDDGVYVARFPARPNEVILARAYVVDPYSKRFVYGPPTRAVCIAGEAKVGELRPVDAQSAIESPREPEQ